MLFRFYVAYILYHKVEKLAIQIMKEVFVYNAQEKPKSALSFLL